MNISNIGAVCYTRFQRDRVVDALATIDGLPNLRPGSLNSEQIVKAKHRAQTRLNRYYRHLEGLLGSINHAKREVALSALRILAEEDVSRLNATYDALEENIGDDNQPGIALFLHIGERSFALLPENDGYSTESQTDHVYMSPRWSRIILGTENNEGGSGQDLRTRIMRSNRLWQRERWSVLPGADTAEYPKEKAAGFFNNIMLHERPVDGWVDAFWGVQSGLRLPVPIDDTSNSLLMVLITNYVPDAFDRWEKDPDRYMNPMPAALATKASEKLQSVFEEELRGLSFVTNLLKDVIDSETNLLNAGMRMLAHYIKGQSGTSARQKSTWEKRVVNVVHGLRQVSPELYEKVSDLERPMEAAIERLEAVSRLLPNTGKTNLWRKDLARQKEKGNELGFTLLSPTCTVSDLVKSLEALQESQLSTIRLSEGVDKYINNQINRSLIHPYLLTAILENLLSKKNVHVTIAIKDDLERLGRRKIMQLTAFYPIWHLSTEDEQDFLLKPLSSKQTGGARNGFYLTAQVLWRVDGLIEYYPLSGHSEAPRSALINLTIPL